MALCVARSALTASLDDTDGAWCRGAAIVAVRHRRMKTMRFCHLSFFFCVLFAASSVRTYSDVMMLLLFDG